MFRNRFFAGYRNFKAKNLRQFSWSSSSSYTDDTTWLRAPYLGAFAAAGILALKYKT